MTTGRIASIFVAAVIVAVVIYLVVARAPDREGLGQPAPHAIDQSQ